VFPDTPIFLADDGSHDATGAIAAASGARVVRSASAIGKGAAVTHAARDALLATSPGAPDPATVGSDPDRRAVFVLCDGDLGDSAGQLGALADAVARGEGDVAVAIFTRRVGGGFGVALSFARWAIRRRTGGLRTRAPISGQRALSRDALKDVLPFADGFGMEIGITIDAVRAGHRLVEIELDLDHRAGGRTVAGFVHRARQLVDFARAYSSRR
jgi:glycosyltransferase involved in cell wall biosynthesis